jgi:antitoxin component of MazEF toxin-antitoxin module
MLQLELQSRDERFEGGGRRMVRRIRPIGNSCGLIIDKAVLDLLNLRAGSPVDLTLAPGGKGILITPMEGVEADAGADAEVDVEAAKAAHKDRVRAAGDRVMERHASAFKRLAE